MPEPKKNPAAQDDDVDDQDTNPGTGNDDQDDGDNGSNDSQGEESVDNLKALIAKLRPHERESKRLAQKLATAEAKLQEIEDAKLSEVERAKKQAADAEAKAQALEAQMRDRSVKHAVASAARDLGFHKPDVAYKLLDLSDVEIGEDGDPQGIDELVKGLIEENPWLVKGTEEKTGKNGPPPTPKPGDQKKIDDEERRKKAANIRDIW